MKNVCATTVAENKSRYMDNQFWWGAKDGSGGIGDDVAAERYFVRRLSKKKVLLVN